MIASESAPDEDPHRQTRCLLLIRRVISPSTLSQRSNCSTNNTQLLGIPPKRNVRVVDLTGESSEVENNAPTRRRQPANAAQVPQNGSRSTPRPRVSNVLTRAIDKLDVETLRTWVKHYAEANQGFTNYLESRLLVPGKDVVRYHVDFAFRG
jgi:hypothetical protein